MEPVVSRSPARPGLRQEGQQSQEQEALGQATGDGRNCSSGDGDCTAPSLGGEPGGKSFFFLFCCFRYPYFQSKSGFYHLRVRRGLGE